MAADKSTDETSAQEPDPCVRLIHVSVGESLTPDQFGAWLEASNRRMDAIKAAKTKEKE